MHRVPRHRVRFAAIAVLAAGLLAGCAGTPQAFLGVPGSYTFGRELRLTVNGLEPGIAGGTVVVCVDHRERIVVTAGPWQPNYFSLTWDGVTQTEGSGTGTYTPWTTDPVGPGCGTLTVRAFTFHVDIPDSVTVWLSEAPA